MENLVDYIIPKNEMTREILFQCKLLLLKNNNNKLLPDNNIKNKKNEEISEIKNEEISEEKIISKRSTKEDSKNSKKSKKKIGGIWDDDDDDSEDEEDIDESISNVIETKNEEKNKFNIYISKNYSSESISDSENIADNNNQKEIDEYDTKIQVETDKNINNK